MPLPGDQHLNIGGNSTVNPFEDVKPRISDYTAHQIATLQSRLEKQLGPEYITSRPGPGGQKIHYLTGEKCIQLANEIFGFNGWSSSIVNIQVDFVDEDPTSHRISLGLSVIVRVTLRDGTYHEDIGYGEMENCKGKGAAFHKAKKEGTTDALKRALRNFGNVLGNCMYDKGYLSRIMKVKVAPAKWDVDSLHRRPEYNSNKEDVQELKMEQMKNYESGSLLKSTVGDTHMEPPKSGLTEPSEYLDEEFDDFDEADFGISHDLNLRPDEVLLPATTSADSCGLIGDAYLNHPPQRVETPQNNLQSITAPGRASSGHPVLNFNHSKGETQYQVQPQLTIPGASAKPAHIAGTSASTKPLQETITTPRPPINLAPAPGRVLNQPSRKTSTSAPQSPTQQQIHLNGQEEGSDYYGPRPALESGFFSARAASMLPDVRDSEGPLPLLPGNLPTFNPHAESPSIRKTPGVDHKRSMPVNRELKHVQGPTHTTGGVTASTGTHVVNPQLDATRKIGAPGSPSPMANRGSYKLPSMKRPLQPPVNMRPPLGDIATNGMTSRPDGGGDIKRPRLSGT